MDSLKLSPTLCRSRHTSQRPVFAARYFPAENGKVFLLETVRGYDIIRMDRKITFEQL